MIISSILKVANYYLETRNKANKMLDIINVKVLIRLRIRHIMVSNIRQVLEFYIRVWVNLFKKIKIRNAGESASKIISECESENYKRG